MKSHKITRGRQSPVKPLKLTGSMGVRRNVFRLREKYFREHNLKLMPRGLKKVPS